MQGISQPFQPRLSGVELPKYHDGSHKGGSEYITGNLIQTDNAISP